MPDWWGMWESGWGADVGPREPLESAVSSSERIIVSVL